MACRCRWIRAATFATIWALLCRLADSHQIAIGSVTAPAPSRKPQGAGFHPMVSAPRARWAGLVAVMSVIAPVTVAIG